MAATIARRDQAAVIDRLEQEHPFREGDEVRSLLLADPELLAVVVETLERIPDYFASERPVWLEVLRDHEDEEGAPELFAVVATRLKPKEALSRLAEFRQAWLVEAVRRSGGRFNVALEYV